MDKILDKIKKSLLFLMLVTAPKEEQ